MMREGGHGEPGGSEPLFTPAETEMLASQAVDVGTGASVSEKEGSDDEEGELTSGYVAGELSSQSDEETGRAVIDNEASAPFIASEEASDEARFRVATGDVEGTDAQSQAQLDKDLRIARAKAEEEARRTA